MRFLWRMSSKQQGARFRTTSNSMCDEQSRIESRSRDAEFSMERSGKTTSCRENHGRVSFWSTSTIILFCFESADRLTKAFQIWQSESRKSFRIERQKTVKNLGRTCTDMLCDWHPPVCLNHQSESGCMYGDKCFQHTGFFGQPSKSQRKVALKDRWLPSLERVDSAPK